MLNKEVFEKVQTHQKKILIVTKYWDTQISESILQDAIQSYGEILYGIGENRIEQILQKNIPRKYMHFIGNIQSQKIPDIVKHCSVVHSLASIKHAQKIEKHGLPIQAFVQVQLDTQKNIGISEGELGDFLNACKNFSHLSIIGLSGMGSGVFTLQEKRNEFQKLISLRNTYLPHGKISAGTSRDYHIALELGIDIVRIGSKIMV